MLYLTELLQEVLEYADARAAAIASILASPRLGDSLRGVVRRHLDGLESELLAQALIAGLTPAELRGGRGLVYEMLGRHDFVVDPLPNLVFTRDSSAWIGDQVAVASLAAPARDREAALLAVLYRHHPVRRDRRAVRPVPGAAGRRGHRAARPGGAGRRGQRADQPGRCGAAGPPGVRGRLAHTVLAVPIECAANGASGHRVHRGGHRGGGDVTRRSPTRSPRTPSPGATKSCGSPGRSRSCPPPPRPSAWTGFTVIGTGLDPVTAPRGQWDDGGNALSLGRGLAVCDERNRRPTTGWPRRACRWSPCPPVSWAAGGAGRAACAV